MHDLKSGEYEIVVSELPAGLEFNTKSFTLNKDGTVRVKARFEKAVAAVKPGTAGEIDQQAAAGNAGFEQWIKDTQKLSPEKQVEAVAAKLKELNRGFDGKVKHTIENGAVTLLMFQSNDVSDITPLRALTALQSLYCGGTNGQGKIADLSPLRGMNLTHLWCRDTLVSDLNPLRGMKLTSLNCMYTPVQDFSPLQETPIKEIFCSIDRPNEVTRRSLQTLKTLERINGKPAAEFLKRGMEADTSFEQWLKDTQKLPAEKQGEAFPGSEFQKATQQSGIGTLSWARGPITAVMYDA
jgi:hypothetical protein